MGFPVAELREGAQRVQHNASPAGGRGGGEQSGRTLSVCDPAAVCPDGLVHVCQHGGQG